MKYTIRYQPGPDETIFRIETDNRKEASDRHDELVQKYGTSRVNIAVEDIPESNEENGISLDPYDYSEIIKFEISVSSPDREELKGLVDDILKLNTVQDLKEYYLDQREWRETTSLMQTFYEFLIELVAKTK